MGKAATHNEDTAARTLGESVRRGGAFAEPDGARVLFLHAHVATLRQVADAGHWTCVQGLRPLADELEAWGHAVQPELPATLAMDFDVVLGLPPRQRDLARACLARAVAAVRPGGQVRMAMTNLEGARSGERDLRALMGTLESESRNKCRVFGGTLDPAAVDRSLLDAWLALDAPRPILQDRYISRPGLFAWNRVDAASMLLAAHLPSDLAGQVADLGAGYGFLACEALRRNPGIRAMHLYEADARALAPARENLRRVQATLDHEVAVAVHWHDVTRGLPRRHDAIVCNPPFHEGRADRPQLGQAFIEAAAGALERGGQLWLVANRHLPYEATLARHFRVVHAMAERDGFKVIHAVRGDPGAA